MDGRVRAAASGRRRLGRRRYPHGLGRPLPGPADLVLEVDTVHRRPLRLMHGLPPFDAVGPGRCVCSPRPAAVSIR
jgi:hypothetical protein